MSKLKILLVILLSLPALIKAQVTDTITLPLNKYVVASVCSPYPSIDTERLTKDIDPSGYVNVMDYGAKGDGVTFDDAAFVAAFQAANSAHNGVIAPAGHIYLFHNKNQITLTSDLTFYAYGATLRMGNLSQESMLQFFWTGNNAQIRQVIWLGGIIDGNQYNQRWPGNPHGGVYNVAIDASQTDGQNQNFTEAHGQLIAFNNAGFVLTKDVQVINTVMDGFASVGSTFTVYANGAASGGAPIYYDLQGDQGTYFKVTKEPIATAYYLNLTCIGGSIGLHTSWPTTIPVPDSVLSVFVNCYCWNQAQDGIHIEDCSKALFYNTSIGADLDGNFYQERLHLSNKTTVVGIEGCNFTEARVNFNQSSNLKIGVINYSHFLSRRTATDPVLPHFAYNAFYVANSTFDGLVPDQQLQLKSGYAINSTFSNFGTSAYAVQGANVVYNCTFNNGTNAIKFNTGGVGYLNTFNNVTNKATNTTPTTLDPEFSSKIVIMHPTGVLLDEIKAK